MTKEQKKNFRLPSKAKFYGRHLVTDMAGTRLTDIELVRTGSYRATYPVISSELFASGSFLLVMQLNDNFWGGSAFGFCRPFQKNPRGVGRSWHEVSADGVRSKYYLTAILVVKRGGEKAQYITQKGYRKPQLIYRGTDITMAKLKEDPRIQVIAYESHDRQQIERAIFIPGEFSDEQIRQIHEAYSFGVYSW